MWSKFVDVLVRNEYAVFQYAQCSISSTFYLQFNAGESLVRNSYSLFLLQDVFIVMADDQQNEYISPHLLGSYVHQKNSSEINNSTLIPWSKVAHVRHFLFELYLRQYRRKKQTRIPSQVRSL